MSKVKFKPIVVSFANDKREVSYHANTVQELIDDMKQDFPDLVFVQAKDNNENNIRGIFVNPTRTTMNSIDADVNNDQILNYYYPAFMCDWNQLATLSEFIV